MNHAHQAFSHVPGDMNGVLFHVKHIRRYRTRVVVPQAQNVSATILFQRHMSQNLSHAMAALWTNLYPRIRLHVDPSGTCRHGTPRMPSPPRHSNDYPIHWPR